MISSRTSGQLHALLTASQRAQRLPSVVAGLTRSGTPLWTGLAGSVTGRAGGPEPTADTQYRIGSITKTFVAVAVLQLRDRGRLDLDDRFDDHVPGTRIGRATLAQLLCHGAGVQAETSGPWWERTPGTDWEHLVRGIDVRFRGGRRHHYSNVGYAALGELLARAHGRPWHEVLRTEILTPLELTRTTLRPDGPHAPGLAVHPYADLLHPEPEHDAGAMGPAGQCWSTIGDLLRWARFLGGDTAGVLSADTWAEMCEPQLVADLPGQGWTAAHGLGVQLWNLAGRRLVGHGGSMPGFQASVLVDPAANTGAGIVCNSTTAQLWPVARELLDLLASAEPAPAEPWTAAGDPGLLELAGPWHWGPATMVARIVGEHLVLGEPGLGRASRFARTGPDIWIGLDAYYAGEPLLVLRTADGRVSHLDVASFRFTRTPYDPAGDVPGGVTDWQ